MIKLIVFSCLIAVAFGGTCPDIRDDPYVNFGSTTADDFLFAQSCGPQSTGSANATEYIKGNGDNGLSLCRIKCKDYGSSPKLAWIEIKGKWKRTKRLQCKCSTRKSGKEVCHWKRQAGNNKKDSMRGLDEDDAPNNAMTLSCDAPTCAHASTIEEFNGGTYPSAEKGGETLCTDCNINMGRGGSWDCFDRQDNPIADGDRVEMKGYCKLTCDNPDVKISKRKLICNAPDEDDSVAYLQYGERQIASLYKFLTRKTFMKNENMSADMGWMCYF